MDVTLETAVIAANLSCGRILQALGGMRESGKIYLQFVTFFERLRELPLIRDNFSMAEKARRIYDFLKSGNFMLSKKQQSPDDREAFEAMCDVSAILDRFPLKALVISDESAELCNAINGELCLVMRVSALQNGEKVTVFDAFPAFSELFLGDFSKVTALFWNSKTETARLTADSEHMLLNLLASMESFTMNNLQLLSETCAPNRYLFQISDLHLGYKDSSHMAMRLERSIDRFADSLAEHDAIQFVSSGDLVNGITFKNRIRRKEFENYLRKRSGRELSSVLGNHDINKHGVALIRSKKKHIINIVGDYPQIKVLDDIGAVLLLFNSNISGRFAKGCIGHQQMLEASRLLESVRNLNKYAVFAVLHHHIVNISEAEFYSQRWYKKFLSTDSAAWSLKLTDAGEFLEWLKQHHIKFVLHGHKHVPFITEHQGINIISCGSSTGKIRKTKQTETCLSYNIIRVAKDSVTCCLVVEEAYGLSSVDLCVMNCGVRDAKPVADTDEWNHE